MPCKICGAPFTRYATGLASVRMQPTCTCGKIRMQERLKGCPVCHAQDTRIQMTKEHDVYTLTCACGAKWEKRP